ncbi:MAG: ribosome-associated translation inhibitor RaiA [Bacteroidetes bacterium]|nr:ribosome-associated translation inhibitor RaiA [Bacteroidota bacterium]
MKIKVTSRHFRARDELVEYAENAVSELEHYYDGITRADVILAFEGSENEIKVAEIRIHVYDHVISSITKDKDFQKAIDAAVNKVLAQLKKFKDKLHDKKRERVRKTRDKL